jgi:DNA repair photolyase
VVLFPEAAPTGPPNLVGIARLAASASLLEAKRQVEYRELPTRHFITRCSGERVPFEWTINPYRGCEFGCKYCFARYAHEFMELRDSLEFERKIFAKSWNPGAFRRELARIDRREAIAIGTATDPYQPAERRYGITRRILETLALDRGRTIWLTTKGDGVARDADVLLKLAVHNQVHISLTITTVDERLARLIEPMAPRPSLRFAAVRALASAGLHVGVLASPIMPLINDSRQSLEALAAAAGEAGASTFSGSVLFLKPSSAKVFLPFLELEFPHLARRYRERFAASAFLRGAYPEMIQKRLDGIRERFGLERRSADPPPDWSHGQLTLFES